MFARTWRTELCGVRSTFPVKSSAAFFNFNTSTAGGQIADYVYFVPFAWLLREVKNVTGYQNLANLGTLELELTLPASATTRIIDVWNVAHNVIHKRGGDVIKAVR